MVAGAGGSLPSHRMVSVRAEGIQKWGDKEAHRGAQEISSQTQSLQVKARETIWEHLFWLQKQI